MDSAELERRRRIWEALSDVFLDTETRWFFPSIASVLVQSGYTTAELNAIWRWEILPECIGNLLQVAGEWSGLRLNERALIRRASRRPGFLARLLWRAPGALLAGEWRQILRLRDVLLQRRPDERAVMVAAWSAFARAYLEESLGRCLPLDAQIARLRAGGLSRADCELTFARDFRPIYAELLMGRERETEEARAENVNVVIARAFG